MTKILLYCFGDLGILSLYVITNDCIFIDGKAEAPEGNLGVHVNGTSLITLGGRGCCFLLAC